jgi:hypothetical protein
MKTRIKLIKRRELESRKPVTKTRRVSGPNSWSKSVRSWVVEFQEQDRTEPQPALDSLFKAEPTEQPKNSD